MSDAIFIANKASGHLAIGDKKELDKAWRKPLGIRLTPTSRSIRDKLKGYQAVLGNVRYC